MATQNQPLTNLRVIPSDYPVDPLNDPNIPIVEINNQKSRRPSRLRSQPRPQRIRVERIDEEQEENIPQQLRSRIQKPNTPARPQVVHTAEEDAETARHLRKQAENAHYSFDSSVQDTINDHSISRQEVRYV